LKNYDEFLSQKPQVVILNKMDIPEVQEKEPEIVDALRKAAGHTRVMSVSAATTQGVRELMTRIRKFVDVQPEPDLPPPPEIDLSKVGLDYDSDDFEIQSDPSYPGQWRVSGEYIEQVARMTHWEYPEAVERFGRQMEALGISEELSKRGAEEGDLIMIDVYDFSFSPGVKNPYIPPELLERDEIFLQGGSGSSKTEESNSSEKEELLWRPFTQGGFLDVDTEELIGFGEDEGWDLLDDELLDEDGNFIAQEDDEVWMDG
jgi:GTP-binding protein